MNRNIAGVFILFVIFILLLHTRPELNMTDDSRGYAIAAETFSRTGEFRVFFTDAAVILPNDYPRGDVSMTLWPPLYPAALSVLDARIINAFALTGIVIFAGFIGEQIWGRRGYAVGVVAAVLSPSLLYAAVHQWTETLYIMLTLAAISAIMLYADQRRMKYVFMVTILCAAAAMTRYAGVVPLAVCGVWLLFLNWRAALIFSVSMLPIGLWALRNYMIDGTLFGPRVPSHLPVIEHTVWLVYVIFQWTIFAFIPLLLLPQNSAVNLRAAAPITAYGLATTVFTYVSVLSTRVDGIASHNARLLSSSAFPLVIALLVFVCVISRSIRRVVIRVTAARPFDF